MKRKIKEFIKSNINLIDTENYDEFWRKVYADATEVFDDYFDVCTVVEFLLDCGANPLANIPNVPPGFLCGSNRSEFIIPEWIKRIEYNAFAAMPNLTSIRFPFAVESIMLDAFESCKNLTYIEFCNPRIRMQINSFVGCHNIKHIKYHGTKEEWDKYMDEIPFYNCRVECTDGDLQL